MEFDDVVNDRADRPALIAFDGLINGVTVEISWILISSLVKLISVKDGIIFVVKLLKFVL